MLGSFMSAPVNDPSKNSYMYCLFFLSDDPLSSGWSLSGVDSFEFVVTGWAA